MECSQGPALKISFQAVCFLETAYHCLILIFDAGDQLQDDPTTTVSNGNDDGDDGDDGIVDGPRIMAHVDISRTNGMCTLLN